MWGMLSRSPLLMRAILPLAGPGQTFRFTRTPAAITTAIAITTCAANSMFDLTFARMLFPPVSVLCRDRPDRLLQNSSCNRERRIGARGIVFETFRELDRTEQIVLGQRTQHTREVKVSIWKANESSAVFSN